jgi:glucose/arabinose dehydrogenase
MNDLTAHAQLRAGTALAVTCLALLLCAPAHAERSAHRTTVKHRPAAASPAKPVASPAVAAPATPAGAAGMVVAIDPETGALVAPTAEQVLTLTAAERTGLMRTSEGLAEVRFPDGSVKVDLQGRFMEYGLVQLDRTGCPHFLCVNDEIVLRALLARYAATSTPAYEEK